MRVDLRRLAKQFCVDCAAVAILLLISGVAVAEPCARVTTLKYPHVAVLNAELVTGGAFTPPAGETIKDLPKFCRVSAVLTPGPDSSIRVEIWMPQSQWNGRVEGTGSGGFAGQIAYEALASGLKLGYAVANTDMGMSVPLGSDASVFLNRPERWADWGYRSTHEMTLLAKELVKVYYGNKAKKAYFVGCSTGGEQALMEAQKFPEDYDGIVGGDAANNRTGVHLSILWNFSAMQSSSAAYIPPSKLRLLHDAVLAKCGTRQEREDAFLNDPSTCRFDPDALLCAAEDNNQCLTAQQLDTAKLMYGGPKDPRTQETFYPGLPYGSEDAWGKLDVHPSAETVPPFGPIFKWVFGAQWDWRSFDFDRQASVFESKLSDEVNATSPDLEKFDRLGHKLLMYHGWEDWLVAPDEAIRYHDAVVQYFDHRNAAHSGFAFRVDSFYRLFMVPGMQHCKGGPGPDSFDSLSAVVDWVEHSKTPDSIVAKKTRSDGDANFQRLLCPFPQVAQYRGSGSVDIAASYQCVASAFSQEKSFAP